MAMSDIDTKRNKQTSPANTKIPPGLKIRVLKYISNPKEAKILK
jgi:hypothetical protein